MKKFRQVLFWMHLVAGLVAGVAIAIMSFTGVILAFEHEIVEWAERDARRVAIPAEVPPLPLDELVARAREAQPELRAAAIVLRNDPGAAVTFSVGRDVAYHVNPYTGELRQPQSTAVQDFMRVMLAWHRFLGREGDSRATGKLINGICNLAFCALALTGLYLWWPRRWTWRSVRAVALFNWRLTGKARDFNWHNTIGLWCAPVLIVLTLTAVPISFRWGNDLVYRLVGEEPPVRGNPRGTGSRVTEDSSAESDAPPIRYSAIVARVQQEFPRWEQISLRGGDVESGAPAGGDPGHLTASRSPLAVTIRESGTWPRTATASVTFDAVSGRELRREKFGDLSTGTRIRRWTRFLHTGEALGWGGQLVAAVASLGGLVLVYTGIALSYRRFFPRRLRPAVSSEERPVSAEAGSAR